MSVTEPNKEEQPKKQGIFGTIKALIRETGEVVVDILSLRAGADIPGTTESIKNDVEFKGHSIWILIFSIFIASIGLNTNSIPIIIGAMLISPLMGPILGIGLGIGTIDIPLMRKSAKNLAIAVVVSIISSFIYFKLTPFQDECPEILARTKPQLFDVLIATFGGLAGIISSSRSERTNVIPGVAIATALMPPLCTAGYGLATGKFEYFAGAFYLFTINASCITITTMLVVSYMRFPKVSFMDKKKERNTKWLIWSIWTIVIIPSGFIFYSVIREDLFGKHVKSFVENEFHFESTYLIKREVSYNADSTSTLELFFYGDLLDSTKISNLNQKALEEYDLDDTRIVYNQGKDTKAELSNRFVDVENTYADLIQQTNQSLALQNSRIDDIHSRLSYYTDSLSIQKLNEECKVLFPRVMSVGYGKMSFMSDSGQTNVIPTYNVDVEHKYRKPFDETKLRDWLIVKNNHDTLKVFYNYQKK